MPTKPLFFFSLLSICLAPPAAHAGAQKPVQPFAASCAPTVASAKLDYEARLAAVQKTYKPIVEALTKFISSLTEEDRDLLLNYRDDLLTRAEVHDKLAKKERIAADIAQGNWVYLALNEDKHEIVGKFGPWDEGIRIPLGDKADEAALLKILVQRRYNTLVSNDRCFTDSGVRPKPADQKACYGSQPAKIYESERQYSVLHDHVDPQCLIQMGEMAKVTPPKVDDKSMLGIKPGETATPAPTETSKPAPPTQVTTAPETPKVVAPN